MGPLNSYMNWCNDKYNSSSNFGTRRVLIPVAVMLVGTSLGVSAIAQHILLAPFKLAGGVVNVFVDLGERSARCLCGKGCLATTLHKLSEKLPTLKDFCNTVLNIFKYAIGAFMTLTVGGLFLSPRANFDWQVEWGFLTDKRKAEIDDQAKKQTAVTLGAPNGASVSAPEQVAGASAAATNNGEKDASAEATNNGEKDASAAANGTGEKDAAGVSAAEQVEIELEEVVVVAARKIGSVVATLQAEENKVAAEAKAAATAIAAPAVDGLDHAVQAAIVAAGGHVDTGAAVEDEVDADDSTDGDEEVAGEKNSHETSTDVAIISGKVVGQDNVNVFNQAANSLEASAARVVENVKFKLLTAEQSAQHLAVKIAEKRKEMNERVNKDISKLKEDALAQEQKASAIGKKELPKTYYASFTEKKGELIERIKPIGSYISRTLHLRTTINATEAEEEVAAESAKIA